MNTDILPTDITSEKVADLCRLTDESMMKCKRALVAAKGDIELASQYLQHSIPATGPSLLERIEKLEQQMAVLLLDKSHDI